MQQDHNPEISFISSYKAKYNWPLDTMRYAIKSDIKTNNGFYYDARFCNLYNIKELKGRIKSSTKKIHLTRKLTKLLKTIPFIELIFITGSVASLNANINDDIDIFLVVKPKRVWITRLLEWIILNIHGIRRNNCTSKESMSDKMDINYYKTSDNLELCPQNEAFAMQFVDSILIFYRNIASYKNMIEHNAWISNYFPSWYLWITRLLNRKVQPILPSIGAMGELRTTTFKLVYGELLNALIQKEREFSKINSFAGNGKNLVKRITSLILDKLEYILGVIQIFKMTHKLELNPKLVFCKEFSTWYNSPNIK